MTQLATLRATTHGDVAVGALEGEIDASNVDELGARLRDLLTNRSTALVVDLLGVIYLDSAGINLLFALGEELRGRQQQLRLVVSPTASITRILSLTGLDRAYPVFADAAEAIEG
jgi:anti-sigma B factor antagonist